MPSCLLPRYLYVYQEFGSFLCPQEMGCCSCFGFLGKPQRSVRSIHGSHGRFSREFLLLDNAEDADGVLYNGEAASMLHGSDEELQQSHKSSEEILFLRAQSGMICREVPVKETRHVIRTEDENGNKMVNEYVRECKIGAGSYGKVVLYRSTIDGKQYAIKAFHKSHLLKLRVAPSETAMTDVLREVSIMKMLDHPNIVNLIEVIDDPNTDNFYMVLEYVEGKWVCEGSGPPGGMGESTARRYLRDIVAGLIYLHTHNIVHGDIKPDNLLVTSSGTVKIGDFSVSQVFEDNNDVLRRSPGTPVFTAPECCLGLTYHGKAADTWALGVTLYCMLLGQYPFLGDTLQDTYDKIVKNPLSLPDGINLQLKNLLEALLCKDPKQRIVLEAVRVHPWVVGEEGPIPEYLCRCKRKSFQGVASV
ncbi:serine/threonine-protein kinase GRIK2-like isoform X2 [Magnolia sinica]|uniref:serine/threonine-protein kinase GRIK2-like isoform X2 n=1 Tax=Magnolia sinica TaxID=86752 RepID=UPI002659B228|nr:serine/threonine-protein kinase GRIK2-like isoform X2 [Magnolia sinica]